MNRTRFSVKTPPGFDFWKTVYSHGWCSLRPFNVDMEGLALRTVLSLGDGSVWACRISHDRDSLRITAESRRAISITRRADLTSLVARCFRLDEDLSDFYRVARKHPDFRWIPRFGAGRLLRAPTAFEDIVKMICTTNCNWSLTTIMVENLCQEFGIAADGSGRAFPTPAAIAGSTERVLRRKIRAGYRSPYILDFATEVASGKLDPETFRASPLSTPDLLKEVQRIKGVGAYAAENLLRLFGRYDYLGLDSWVRAKFSEIHYRGRRVSDRTIQRRYQHLGTYRGLFFWMEMTRDWYDETFPF